MAFGSIIGAIAGPLIGGLLKGDASENAANVQGQSAEAANRLQKEMFDTTRGDLGEYRTVGGGALTTLANLVGLGGRNSDGSFAGYNSAQSPWLQPFDMSKFQASPAYQFNLDQGRQAIDKAASARGRYYAPATLQDISKYSQGLASNEFQNSFSNYYKNIDSVWGKLSQLAGSGQNAAVAQGGFNSNYANNVGNNLIGAGNSQAAGIVGSANAVNSALGNGYNNYLTQQILGRNQAPTYGTPTYTGGSSPGYGYDGLNRDDSYYGGGA